MDDSNRTSEGSTKTTPALRTGIATTSLEWTTSFHRQWNAKRIIRLVAFFLIIMSGVGLITGKDSLALFVGLLLAIFMSRWLLPITYRIGSEGIYQSVLGHDRFKPWADFQAAQVSGQILQLTPRQSLLRGRARIIVTIPLCEANRDTFEKLQRLIPLRLTYDSRLEKEPTREKTLEFD